MRTLSSLIDFKFIAESVKSSPPDKPILASSDQPVVIWLAAMDLEKEFPGNHWEYRTLITRTNAESLGITGYAISHNCNLSTPLYVVQYGIGSDKAVEMESQGVAESIYFRNTPELSNETFLFQYQQHLKAVEEYFNSRLKGISDILEKLQ